MRRWQGKAVLFVFCLLFSAGRGTGAVESAAALLAFSVACLFPQSPSRWMTALFAVTWTMLTAASTAFGLFWPLLMLDLLWGGMPYLALPSVVWMAVRGGYGMLEAGWFLALMALALLLYDHEHHMQALRLENHAVRDAATEAGLALAEKNRQLVAAQDQNMKLATLRERERIAREMHDSVGHLLARGLMQTGALMTLQPAGPTAEGLGALKQTLDAAMDSVRRSVHGLHDESFDLYLTVQESLQPFTSYEVNLNYDIPSDTPQAIKTAFAAILQEALSNISRHSDATRIQISLQEHPQFYQMGIADNGTPRREKNVAQRGMGLENMQRRAEAIGGRFVTRRDHGFSIHVTVPKA